jgi:site-specific recombinase XerD
MSTPLITIFVRHSADCRYAGDEFSKRCNCRKHLRWSQNGKQYRQKAGTRSWAEAEEVKRRREDELAGRIPTQPNDGKLFQDAIDVFLKDKRVQGITPGVIAKYTLQLGRLREYCERNGVHTVQGITRELLTGFCATWEEQYPSSITRAKNREKLRSFLRYCYECKWLERVPAVPKFKIEEPETQPLTPEEYERLLASIRAAVSNGDPRRRTERNNGRRSPDEEERIYTVVRAFIQCMKWSGLAIRDAVTLPASALEHDRKADLYSITTKRAKTGTPVSIPIPAAVAAEMLSARKLNDNPEYFFWSGKGDPQSATSNWGQRYIAPIFKEAGIVSDGNMLSHRLRDTFAVDLLEKGVPMEELSRLLGHKSIRTTEKHYAKWSRGRQDRLNALVIGTWATPKRKRRTKAERLQTA